MVKKQNTPSSSVLTDEQIEAEEKFLEGIPRFNIAAFLLAPIWGPVHGMWAAIFFYPLWALADNMFYAAYTQGTALPIVFSIILGAILLGGSIAFSLIGQPLAAHRAVDRGMSKEAYVNRQKIWTVVSIFVAILIVAAATYYNLVIRSTLVF